MTALDAELLDLEQRFDSAHRETIVSKGGRALNERAYKRMDDLSNAINRERAHTLAGLAVKARVAVVACDHYWDMTL